MGTLEVAYLTIALGLFFNFSNGFHDASNIVHHHHIIEVHERTQRAYHDSTPRAFRIALPGHRGCKDNRPGDSGYRFHDRKGHHLRHRGSHGLEYLHLDDRSPFILVHAIIGGLMGASLQVSGPDSIEWKSVLAIFGVILISPILGFISAFHLTRMNFRIFRHVHPVVATGILKRLQIFSAAMLAISHGTNDAQKAMGIITMSLIILHRFDPAVMAQFYDPGPGGAFTVPLWVILSCSFALSAGMLSGGRRIMKTMGTKLFKIKPIHGFGAMLSTSLVVFTCSLFGFPVSTTHISSSGIVGGGAAQRLGIVRWGLAKDIILTWLFTIPASASLAYLLSLALQQAF